MILICYKLNYNCSCLSKSSILILQFCFYKYFIYKKCKIFKKYYCCWVFEYYSPYMYFNIYSEYLKKYFTQIYATDDVCNQGLAWIFKTHEIHPTY